MSTKVNKTAIGAFVLGAVVLLVAGVLVLGAGKLFTTEQTYITYFDGSVKGLNVGSPVTFRGVKVGEVKDITITVYPVKGVVKIPVVFDIEPAKFKGTGEAFQKGDRETIEKAVNTLGLRSQLQTQSFVTGQLVVALDFFPGTPANFVGTTKDYPEIPSIQNPLEQLQKRLESLPLKEILDNVNTTLLGVQRVLASVDMKKTSAALDGSLRDLQALLLHVDKKIDPLVASISSTSRAAETTLNEAKETLAEAKGHLKNLSASTTSTLDAAQSALQQSKSTLQSYSGDSQIQAQMIRTLRELDATLRALRSLSDYLERHPESVIRGKRDKGD